MTYTHRLADDEKRELLRIARATLREHSYSGRIPPGKPHRESLLAPAAVFVTLHRADALASGKPTEHVEYCERLLREWTEADLNPPPLLTGIDLITTFGLRPGPLFKRLLDAVREAQLDGTIRTREEALDLVRRLLKEWGEGKA